MLDNGKINNKPVNVMGSMLVAGMLETQEYMTGKLVEHGGDPADKQAIDEASRSIGNRLINAMQIMRKALEDPDYANELLEKAISASMPFFSGLQWEIEQMEKAAADISKMTLGTYKEAESQEYIHSQAMLAILKGEVLKAWERVNESEMVKNMKETISNKIREHNMPDIKQCSDICKIMVERVQHSRTEKYHDIINDSKNHVLQGSLTHEEYMVILKAMLDQNRYAPELNNDIKIVLAEHDKTKDKIREVLNNSISFENKEQEDFTVQAVTEEISVNFGDNSFLQLSAEDQKGLIYDTAAKNSEKISKDFEKISGSKKENIDFKSIEDMGVDR